MRSLALPLALLLALSATATAAVPTAAAYGPCDDPVTALYCIVVDVALGTVDAVRDGVQQYCDDWLNGCKINTLLP